MKVVAFLFITLMTQLPQAFSADQARIDEWISLAHNLSPKEITHQGPISCKSGIDQSYEAFDKTQTLADGRSFMLCLRHQCEEIGRQMQDSLNHLASLPREEQLAFLEYLFYSPAESEALLQKMTLDNGLQKLDCINGGPSVRRTVFTLCTATPRICTKA